MEKNFVVFCSPGTFVAEQTTKEIPSWDTDIAMAMALSIKERYGATPYGFCFITRARDENNLDSHEIRRSGMYYLGGKIETLKEVKSRNDPNERILVSNMKCNGYKRIINSWKWTMPLNDGDVVLDFNPAPPRPKTPRLTGKLAQKMTKHNE